MEANEFVEIVVRMKVRREIAEQIEAQIEDWIADFYDEEDVIFLESEIIKKE